MRMDEAAARAGGAGFGGFGVATRGALGMRGSLSSLTPQGADATSGGAAVRWLLNILNPIQQAHGGESNEFDKMLSGMDKLGGTTVDGRPVSKSNPMPVTVADGAGGGGGGFWSTVGNLFSSAANALTGGGDGGGVPPRGKVPGAGGGGGTNDSGGPVSVPNIAGMTDDERNKLGLILKYESRGKNVMNYMGRAQGLDPSTAKGYTAQGFYQMLNSNWRRLAPKLGIKTRNAMASSLEDQTKVALALMRESGIGNWANFNPSLKRALLRGEQAGKWAEKVPVPSAANTNRPDDQIGGARTSAAMSSVMNDNRSSSSSSFDTRIGTLNVHTKAADPQGIADTIWGEIDNSIRRSGTAATANYGPA